MRPVIAVLLLLAGCASTGADYKGAPDSDVAACELESEKSRTGGGYGGAIGVASYYESYNRVFDACMRSKGYAKR